MSNYKREGTSAYIWLIATLGVAFVFEIVLLSPWWPSGGRFVGNLVLTVQAMHEWRIWSLLTHSLIHSIHSPFHILFVLLSLFYIGRELEPLLGKIRFSLVFVVTVLGGGTAWLGVNFSHQNMVFMGAGAGVVGLFVILACIFPDRELRLWPIPISFKMKQVVWILLAIDVTGLVLYEIAGALPPIDFSPSAHLGGMLAGWVYFRFFHANNGWDRASSIELPAWLRRRKKAGAAPLPTKVNLRRPSADLRVEVDRILDKINSQGFGALTAQEKKVLDDAKDLLSRP